MATMTCPKCGTPNRPNAKFCAKCRAPLSAPSAGAPVPPAAPPPPPVTPRQPPAAPPPPPVTPRQPPAPPPPAPRQPPQAARPAARRGLFTRGRIIGAVIGIMLLCLCVVLAFTLREPLSQVAQRYTMPASTQPIVAFSPTPLTSSPTLKPTTPAVTPATSTPMPIVTPSLAVVASATPTQPPSATPTSTPIATQKPTATPAASPTTAVQPTATPTDTAAGSVLHPGESWRVGTQVMTLQNPRFAGTTCGAILEFEVVFENTDAREVVVSLRGQEWKVTDEHNQPYEIFFWQGAKPTDCNGIVPLATLDKTALAAREKYQVGLQVRGKLADNVNQFQFIATKAGRIANAKWEITVPR